MKVTVDSKKGLKTNLKVFVEKKTIEEKMGVRLTELSKTVNLKGFRPGKVPADVLKRQFGKAVYGEVLDQILKETSTKAIEEKKIKVAGQPKLDLKSYGEGKDLNYTLEIDELPSIKLKSIENIKFIDYEIKVTEKEIEKRIDDIAKNQNNFKDKNEKETAENDDLVAFDYEATIDNKEFKGGEGKNTQLVLGKDLFIKGFDKQLIGLKKSDQKKVEAVLPENYPEKEYANKKAIFDCKIITVKKPEKTKINDEFAKNLGAKDLNNLKELISKQINEEYKNSLDAITNKRILNQLEKFKVDEIPDNLIEQEVKILSQGLKEEEIKKNKKDLEDQAKKRIKTGLILNQFGEQNNIKVSDQEMQTEIQKQLRTMPGQEKMIQEYYQKNPSALASLRGSLYEEKIIQTIKDKTKATKIEITQVEAQKLLKEENERNVKEQSQEFKDIDTNTKKVKNSLKTKKPKKTSKKSLSTKAKSKKVSKK